MIEDIPDVLYLQWYGADGEDEPGGRYNADVTWCDEQINENDIKYIIADDIDAIKEAAREVILNMSDWGGMAGQTIEAAHVLEDWLEIERQWEYK